DGRIVAAPQRDLRAAQRGMSPIDAGVDQANSRGTRRLRIRWRWCDRLAGSDLAALYINVVVVVCTPGIELAQAAERGTRRRTRRRLENGHLLVEALEVLRPQDRKAGGQCTGERFCGN